MSYNPPFSGYVTGIVVEVNMNAKGDSGHSVTLVREGEPTVRITGLNDDEIKGFAVRFNKEVNVSVPYDLQDDCKG